MYPRSKARRSDPVLIFALLCFPAFLWLLGALILAETPQQIFAESGQIERASALYLFIAALILVSDLILRRNLEMWHLVVLVLAAALRELDWDKAFTDSGILSLRLYSGAAPMGQKIVAALVLTLLVWAGLRLLRRNLGNWIQGLRGRESWAFLLAMSLALYLVTKTFDGLGRKLEPFGIELSDWVNRTLGRSEEVLELFAAILLLQVVVLVRLCKDCLNNRSLYSIGKRGF
jgi:hypothetical protein